MSIYTYTPFTYLIGWKSQNLWYYGVRYAKGCKPEDLWLTYFTSSKLVTKVRLELGEPDIIEVRKTFNNKYAAQLWESKLLRRISAATNPKFLNKSNGDKNFYDIGPRSLETKNKISNSRKGSKMNPRSPETKTKISEALKNKPKSKEARENMARAKIGRKFSEEHKENMRKSKLGVKRGPYRSKLS
jgi:hypothetical protein